MKKYYLYLVKEIVKTVNISFDYTLHIVKLCQGLVDVTSNVFSELKDNLESRIKNLLLNTNQIILDVENKNYGYIQYTLKLFFYTEIIINRFCMRKIC